MSRVGVFLTAAIVLLVATACSGDSAFDSDAWKTWDGASDRRLDLIDSMRRSVAGETQPEVKESLGPPGIVDPPDFVACRGRSDCTIWGYRIGSAGFILREPRGAFLVFVNGEVVDVMIANWGDWP
jgi:hypothetical protein